MQVTDIHVNKILPNIYNTLKIYKVWKAPEMKRPRARIEYCPRHCKETEDEVTHKSPKI